MDTATVGEVEYAVSVLGFRKEETGGGCTALVTEHKGVTFYLTEYGGPVVPMTWDDAELYAVRSDGETKSWRVYDAECVVMFMTTACIWAARKG